MTSKNPEDDYVNGRTHGTDINDELFHRAEKRLKQCANSVASLLPEGVGFTVVIHVPIGLPNRGGYISNDGPRVMCESLQKVIEANE